MMKGKWFGIPIIFLLLSASAYSFVNDDYIEEWLLDNAIPITIEEIETLPIQNEEHWPILIVDFKDKPTTPLQSLNLAEDLLIPKSQDYFDELSGGTVNLTIDIHHQIITASENLAFYGSDYGTDRDSSSDGTHLPLELAKEVITSNKNSINWEKYDLNSDGMVDRLLILHTAVGQEIGGNSNRIWSHYTTLDEIIDLPGDLEIGHYTMAALGSGDEGFGTAMHEMLHQMGAYDLYPSHREINSAWKGVGDWDIMASGNWNDGGKNPAIPMSSTLENIGLDRYELVNMNWLNSETVSCNGPEIQLATSSQSSNHYKIEIDSGEYVWIEYRGNTGFDSSLPGSGVLVSYQDTTVSGFEENELNVDSTRPYLTIIEADGNNDLLEGRNDGDSGDTFVNGSKFGSEGIEIRTHDGVLVDWYAEVIISTQASIQFFSSNCMSNLDLNLPDYSITTLLNSPVSFSATSTINCDLTHQLTSSDGRLLTISKNQLAANEEAIIEINFNTISNPNSLTRIQGDLMCGAEIRDIDTTILTLERIPVNSSFEGTIGSKSNSQVSIPIDSIGAGSQNFEIMVDGPLSRIADSGNNLNLDGQNDELILNIDPKGLLTNNMIIKGDIEIRDSTGNLWFVNIELEANDEKGMSIGNYLGPGQMISIALLFAASWVFLTLKERDSNNNQEDYEIGSLDDLKNYNSFDAWGREIDD